MAVIILGVAVTAFGIFAITRPTSWWFKRIGEDDDPSEDRLWWTRFAGLMTVIMGALIIFGGVLKSL